MESTEDAPVGFEPFIPSIAVLFVGLALDRLWPSGPWGVSGAFAVAVLVCVVGYWRRTRQTKISLMWTAAFCGVSILTLLAITAYYRTRLATFTTTPEILLQPYISGQAFRAADLTRDYHEAILKQRTFENCEIHGPGMIGLGGRTLLQDNTIMMPQSLMSKPNIELLAINIIPIDDDVTVYGSLLCQDCTFRKCKFHGVQFLAFRDQREKILAEQRACEASGAASGCPMARR